MASSTRKCVAGLGNTSISHYSSGATQNNDVIVATPGQVLQISITNKGSAMFCLFFDATAVPTNGTVPSIIPIACPANTTVTLNLSTGVTSRQWDGWAFAAGLAWSASSTAGTLTADATNSLWVDCRFVN